MPVFIVSFHRKIVNEIVTKLDSIHQHELPSNRNWRSTVTRVRVSTLDQF